MGAPIRVHYLGDLVSGTLPPAKAYIFLNPFHLDRAARARIAEATAQKTAVYFYGSGFLGQGRADDRLISELIGMPVSRVQAEGAEVTFVQGNNPLLTGLSPQPFGTKAKLSPLWAVEPRPGITPLAVLPSGETLVAAKRDGKSLRVYIGTTDAPAALLRNVLKASGVHIYVDSDDVVSADDGFLALTATAAGRMHVALPQPTTVRDLCEDRVLGKDISQFEVQMDEGETRLYVLEHDQ